MGLFSCKFLFRETPAFSESSVTVAELYKATFYCLLQKMLCTNDLKTGVSCLVLVDRWFKM